MKEKSNHSTPEADRSPRRLDREPIAIVGIGCRYPGAAGPGALWELLTAGRETVFPYQETRFPVLDALYAAAREGSGGARTDRGGFLREIDRFDAQFFELSPRESVYIDPQHRLLLEVAQEALDDAGLRRDQYRGSKTGVYAGLWTSEYETRLYESSTPPDFYAVTGCGRSSASGRLSFMFGLEGPSITVDTACSSSMVAVHMACQALWAGDISMALAGGANLILGPEITELFTQAKMLSPDGRCKFGDDSADGFVRSEGAGIIVLKRLEDAMRDGDRVYAVIRGGAVNNDGRSSGLLVTPSREGQEQMLRAAWQSAGIDPRDLCHIEMHGTGTSVGDPVEVDAAGAALAAFGSSEKCPLGSIKSNIGHTESAAGVAGVIKTALLLHHRQIPPSLHCQTPNPKIAWDAMPVEVARASVALTGAPGSLLAGVSSFGITGTNAHLVLGEAPATAAAAEPAPASPGQPLLLPFSARSPEALTALAGALGDAVREAGQAGIRDLCYTALARRDVYEERAAVVGSTAVEMEAGLAALAAGQEAEGVVRGRGAALADKVVFVAPGQGSQWPGMARELFAGEKVFRDAFTACDRAIAAEAGWSLIDRVLGADAEASLQQIDVIQPALFAMSVALAAVWQAWGIQPAAVVGHSMGEVAAAHLAGILSLEDAARVICRRSRLMKTLPRTGSMAAVELPLAEVQALLSGRSDISVGASNGPGMTVISGETAAVEALLEQLSAREVYCRLIKVDVASHSAQVDPILKELREQLAELKPQHGHTPMLSTVTGEWADGTRMGAAYWVENLRRSVLFAPAVRALAAAGHAVFVELSPHPILLPSLEASARQTAPAAVAVASLRRDKPERATLLTGLAALYAAGYPVDAAKLYPAGGRCVSLPLYPFQRERCWPEPPRAGDRAQRSGASPLLGQRFESALQPGTLLWETELGATAVPYLNDHRVLRSAVFPAAGYVEMALQAARNLLPETAFSVVEARFESTAYLPEQGAKAFQIALIPEGEGFQFEVRSAADAGESAWPLRARGRLRRVEAPTGSVQVDPAALQARAADRRDAAGHYARTARSGLQYGPAFALVEEVWVSEGEALCRLKPPADLRGSMLHPALLDACFQAMAHVRPEDDVFRAEDTYLPVEIAAATLLRPVPAGPLYAEAKLAAANRENATFTTDLRLLDGEGMVVATVKGMTVKRVARQDGAVERAPLYGVEWIPEAPLAAAPMRAAKNLTTAPQAAGELWMLLADAHNMAATLKSSLEYLGGRCILVRPGANFAPAGENGFTVHPDHAEDLKILLETVAAQYGVPAALVDLWSLDLPEPGSHDADGLMESQQLRTARLPGLVQAISAQNWTAPPRLWMVTAGAIATSDAERPRLEQAPLWGIGRAVAREHAELRASLVDLSAAPTAEEARALAREIAANGREDRVCIRANTVSVARLKALGHKESAETAAALGSEENYRLEITQTGIIENIQARAVAPPIPGPDEIVVEVSDAGLNFSDVTKVMGLYPGLEPEQAIPLGNEAVGTVRAVGAAVRDFAPGNAVIALTPTMRLTGMMGRFVAVPAELAVKKPANLTTEQAATVMVVYLTAYWGLVEQAHLAAGEWVLIHAGAGGVGLAAIEIAKSIGARIIVTVGSKEKAEHVRGLGVEHIFDSRSESFAAGVMALTGGRGVDVLLNSLSGDLLTRSLEVMAPYGRFVELGKRDIYGGTRVPLHVFRNNVSFHVVDVAAAVEDRQRYVGGLMRAIIARLGAGEWPPLPVRTFSSADAAEPFRYMAQARHIGKICVHMETALNVLPRRDADLFRRDSSYLITGGLGGVGLEVAEWMAAQGAGKLLLVSRRKPSADAMAAMRRMEACGAQVEAIAADITRAADVDAMIERVRAGAYPLRGILHAAAVIDDALISDLSPERFAPVLAPKVRGAWNLHAATTCEPLDYFVLFSSIAAIDPQPGMASYAAANAFLDAFAHYRRVLGLPAISINWGGWDQIGLARKAGTGRSIEGYGQQGMPNLTGTKALAALERALRESPVQAVALPYVWDRLLEFYGAAKVPPLYAAAVAQLSAADSAGRSEILEALLAADDAARPEILESYLQDVLSKVLKLPAARIDRDRPMGTMGLDSLMGLELVRRLSNAFEIAVPATVVFNYPNVRQLAAHLLRRLQLDADEAPEAASPVTKPAVLPLADDVSEEEALQALIAGAGERD